MNWEVLIITILVIGGVALIIASTLLVEHVFGPNGLLVGMGLCLFAAVYGAVAFLIEED